MLKSFTNSRTTLLHGLKNTSNSQILLPKQRKSWQTLIAGESESECKKNSLTATSIAAMPSFPGLRRFPEGRGFKQWTGDDSKALMKVVSASLVLNKLIDTFRYIYQQSAVMFHLVW